MRIRTPFAGAFIFLVFASAYLGLSSIQLGHLIDDKILHFICFFLLTLTFYWVIDTSRRRTLHFTLVVCTFGLGLGSEVLQGALPNGRTFDPYDILANLLGSLLALGLCTFYHRRMLERKRLAKATYHVVPTDEEADLELGALDTGAGAVVAQESGTTNVEAELANWDEHAEDAWDEEDGDGERGGDIEREESTTTTTGGSADVKTPDSDSFGFGGEAETGDLGARRK